MGWGKVDDRFHRHRKVRKSPLDALGLWVVMLSYLGDVQDDADRVAGAFTSDELRAALVARGEPQRGLFRRASALASALVTSGLWEVTGDGWRFHDWDDWSGNRNQLSELRAAAGRLGGQASGATRRSKREAIASRASEASGSDSDSDSDSDSRRERHGPSPEREAKPPAATSPHPTSGTGAKRAKRAPSPLAPLAEDWDPRPEIYRWAVEEDGVHLEPDEVDRQLAAMRDWAASTGVRKKNWRATFHGWLRRTRERNPKLPEATPADLFTRVKPPPVPPVRPDIEAALAEGTAMYLKRIEAGERMPTVQEAAERTARMLTGTDDDEAGE